MSQSTETHEDRSTETKSHVEDTWKIRHVKMPTPLWVAAARKANAQGLKISKVVRLLLEGYVDGTISLEVDKR